MFDLVNRHLNVICSNLSSFFFCLSRINKKNLMDFGCQVIVLFKEYVTRSIRKCTDILPKFSRHINPRHISTIVSRLSGFNAFFFFVFFTRHPVYDLYLTGKKRFLSKHFSIFLHPYQTFWETLIIWSHWISLDKIMVLYK